MPSVVHLSLLLFLASSLTPEVTPARILGIFPHIGKSHFFVFEPLMKALAARGHDVYVISNFPQLTPVAHYSDISVEGSTEFEATGGMVIEDMVGHTPWQDFFDLRMMGLTQCEQILSFPSIQELLKSSATFDLVISELFNTDCFLGFVHKYNAPHVALSSCVLMPWANDRFGNPDNPAYIPNNLGQSSNIMTLKERFENVILYLGTKLLYHHLFTKPAQSVAAKYFGETLPSLTQIARNTSLILVNSHPSLNGVRPIVPSVIEVGGLHVHPPKKLPEELESWLNESTHGVIYFSMGSNLDAETHNADKRAALLEAFAELPQRVLWKGDCNSFPGQPDNVRVAKWLPQRDILNHPNVRVFMTHGGLLSIIEAVTSAVPMIATPFFGDQYVNSKAVEQRGVAILLDYNDITKESLLKVLRTVLENSSYQENANQLSEWYLDRPHTAMETAIYWTEYVLRHKGAPHLRSAAVELAWYEYLLLDVALALLAAILVLLVIILKVARATCGGSTTEKAKQH